MLDYICLIFSILILILFGFLAFMCSLKPYRQRNFFKAFYVFAAGVFISSTIAFIPLYLPLYETNYAPPIMTFLSSIHNSIRLFIVDCDMSFILEQTASMPAFWENAYLFFFGVVFIVSPLLTISVVLSFFAEVSAHFKYTVFCYNKDVYIFSELNERSISLAKSLKQNDPSRVIIFTDVYKKDDETTSELIEQAKEVSAILYKSDITVANFRFHSKNTKMYFLVIGLDEVENIDHVIHLASPAKTKGKKHIYDAIGYDYEREDTRIILFSRSFSSEQHISVLNPKFVKIRRVNDIQSLIYNLLDKNGNQIFESAIETGNTVYNPTTGKQDKEMLISALVIGLGMHGTEMVKALSWFGQMYPYKLEINAFDKSANAASVFRSSYPDLYDCDPSDPDSPEFKEDGTRYHNGDYTTPGEAHYKINIHTKADITLSEFDEEIKKLTNTTYVFVSLGSDDLNIKASIKLRILFRRLGLNPIIHTIIYNPNSQVVLISDNNQSKESYSVIPFGNRSTTYSEECVLNSQLEKDALERHMKYVNHLIEEKNITGAERDKMLAQEEETFWRYDYNYRSSVASIIHTKYKKICKVPGSDKASPADRTEDEKVFYRILEHKRWNAYVRSEGYVFTPVRDRLAKTHNLLVPFDKLPYSEQIKDDD